MSDQLSMEMPGEPIGTLIRNGGGELLLIPEADAQLMDKIGRDMAEEDRLEFDWSTSPNIVIREQPATALYLNPEGSLVIRQKADWDREEDTFVYIAPNNIEAFIDELTDMVGIPSVGGPAKPPARGR
ncbi:MAG: hypothetical protein Q8M24_18565 [Pseudolabrys sp.]|nr:hypothetical protein [Pseudolabrys sp.]MDP2297450.1 hypothetical protein [Pseudolabrys sp.]